MEKALEVKNLSVFNNGTYIIKDITFEMFIGELLIIIGPNGSGKTTLINAILGLRNFEGEVKIFSKKPSPDLFLKRKISYVPQKISFDKTIPITVFEFLALSSNDKEQITEILDLAGIKKLRDSKIFALSGGEIQRLLIARGLLKRPELFILDEPVAGIDMIGEKGFYDFILNFKTEFKSTVILVSHDVTVAPKIADKILGLNKRLIFFGRPDEVLEEENFIKTYGEGTGVFKHKPCKEGEPCEFFKMDKK